MDKVQKYNLFNTVVNLYDIMIYSLNYTLVVNVNVSSSVLHIIPT
jgi:hypothetical protein